MRRQNPIIVLFDRGRGNGCVPILRSYHNSESSPRFAAARGARSSLALLPHDSATGGCGIRAHLNGGRAARLVVGEGVLHIADAVVRGVVLHPSQAIRRVVRIFVFVRAPGGCALHGRDPAKRVVAVAHRLVIGVRYSCQGPGVQVRRQLVFRSVASWTTFARASFCVAA